MHTMLRIETPSAVAAVFFHKITDSRLYCPTDLFDAQMSTSPKIPRMR
jgi:hypothetical protein